MPTVGKKLKNKMVRSIQGTTSGNTFLLAVFFTESSVEIIFLLAVFFTESSVEIIFLLSIL
jgi:hypothetical protein